ncbi:hypothetical protein [Gimesia sp.]|uniref:hypothetical protein n=1 Tax=Gimesia sp. TaxID=2024833 RepID=UPI003A8FB330
MEKVALSAVVFLVILIAILFLVPDERSAENREAQSVVIQRQASELLDIENLEVTSDGILQFTRRDETGLRTFHHFINVKSGNIVIIEDEEFEPQRIMMSDTVNGGLEITVAKSLNLNLSSTQQRRSPH